jgi:DNA-binding transcriptional ArsR family regulator
MTVSSIQKELRIQQPLVSQHLKSLRISNLVITRRDGRFIYYSRNPHVIKSLFDCCKRFSMAQETLSGNYLDETESSKLNPDIEATHNNDVQSS